MITTKQRAFLRGLANSEEPIFQIGKGGITPNLTVQVKDALAAREMIKISILETSPITPRDAANELSVSADADIVQVIGRKITLYKKNEKEPKIELPKSAKR